MILFTHLKLAFRNVFRNKRRSFITLCSVITGGVVIILVGGYIDYTYWGLREITIHSQLGHIQLYKEGFLKEGQLNPQKYLFNEKEGQDIDKRLNQFSEITQIAKRLSLSGLLSNGDKTVFFLGEGIEAEKESEISSSIIITEGSDLFDDDQYKILVGKELAAQLNLKVGSTVTLLATTLYGSVNALDFQVAGIISTGIKTFDDKVVRLPINNAQELLGTQGFERFVILLDQTEHTQNIYEKLMHDLKDSPIEAKQWLDLAVRYKQVKRIYDNIFTFLKGMILIIIVLSIINTMTMAVMERVVEIGTLRAMGTHRYEILLMMLSEGLFLGILGGVLSLIIGCFFAFAINWLGGISLPPPPGHTTGYMILISIVPQNLIFTFLLSVVAAVFSSLLPSIKAAELKVTDALRHV